MPTRRDGTRKPGGRNVVKAARKYRAEQLAKARANRERKAAVNGS